LKDLEEWQRNIRSKERFENANANLNADSQSNSVVSTHFDGKQTLTLDSKIVSNAESKVPSNTETKTTTNSYQFADFDKLYNPYKVRITLSIKFLQFLLGSTRN